MAESGKFGQLFSEFKAGGITRRQFMERALALGVGLPVAMFVANSYRAAGAPAQPRAGGFAVRQDGTASAPAVGMDGKTRGQGGELKLLQWQAPTLANPHVATGTKDFLAACLVLEPLMNYLPDGTIIPTLVDQVPTVENGQLAEDLTNVTFKLKDGLLWSDGEKVTPDDVIFTWNWIMDTANGSVSIETWRPIQNIEAIDDTSFKVTYPNGTLSWAVPFTGTTYGYILPKHVLEGGKAASDAFLQKPIGTGPYVISDFKPNDQVIYEINPNYRDPNKPFFATVNLKGGGDPASAARAVLQTGDWDYAWNLQVEPAVLNELKQSGDKGQVVALPGTNLERININFSDPNKEVNGERSQKDTPHPFLTDKAVRQAMAMAVDRETISTQFYGEGEPATANVVNGIPAFASPNTSFTYDLDGANKVLDDAGWAKDGDVRKKDGIELSLTYSTSINPVRQKTQAVVKNGFEKIGIKVKLEQVDSGIFFDSSPGNEQNIGHMYVDINMYTNGPSTPVPVDYMNGWYAGPDGVGIAQKANGWNSQNFQRWSNADYDAAYKQLQSVTDPETAAQLIIQMNDILVNEYVVIAEVNRAADKYAISNRLVNDNVALSAFELNYWNIANWVTAE